VKWEGKSGSQFGTCFVNEMEEVIHFAYCNLLISTL
jgi:hypothetical protein